MTPEQTWLNLCMPLDQPFIDNITLEEITKDNPYPLKESSLIEYNESRVYLALLLIFDYYKNTQPEKKMLFQIHRNSSAFPFIDIFTHILTAQYKDDCLMKKIVYSHWPADPKNLGFPCFTFSNGFYLEFLNGYEDNTLTPLPSFSVVFSLSLMGRLSLRILLEH